MGQNLLKELAGEGQRALPSLLLLILILLLSLGKSFCQVPLGRNLHKELRAAGGGEGQGGGGGGEEARRQGRPREGNTQWQEEEEQQERQQQQQQGRKQEEMLGTVPRIPSSSNSFTFSPETIGPGPKWRPTQVSKRRQKFISFLYMRSFWFAN